jgi:ABC-type sugar transport system ATPase subunit
LLLQAESLSKQYDGRYALHNVDFDIMQGEVLALTGENGAGKSTLVRILTGVTGPDSGRIRMDGNEVIIQSPAHARKLGIAAVHQDFDLAPNMTVAENLVLGTEPQWLPRLMPGFINLARQHELALARLAAVGLNLDPDTLVAHLSVAERQLVAIAISIASPVRLLVLDEPTSSLAADDIEHLLGVIDRQRDAGTAVLFISHKLHEVFRVADRICVFRDGRSVGRRKTTGTGIPEIVSMMVGRELEPRDHRAGAVTGDVLLEVFGLRARRLGGSIDLALHYGEILGIYGLKGSGRMELLRVLFGLQSSEAGEIRLEGRALRIRSPSDAIRCGIGWVCRDRKELGLFGNFNVRENLTVAALDSLATGGFVDRRAERQAVSGLIQRLAVKTAGPEQHITALSGGNQQKVLLARWLLCHPSVLILDEPTVGIDIGARSEIHALMSELAGEGIGILLVSSELPEVLTLSDRVLVMHDGAFAGALDRAEASEERVMQLVHAHNLPKSGQEQSPASA